MRNFNRSHTSYVINKDNPGHNILRLFNVLPIFFSPQVKRSVIISNKHDIHELPRELKNDLRLRIFGNQEISGKSLNFIELLPSPQSSLQNENFVNTSTKLPENGK